MADPMLVNSQGMRWVSSILSESGWRTQPYVDGRSALFEAGHPRAERSVEIQVKAASGHVQAPNWLVNERAQRLARMDSEWFVFVILGAEPRGFVVPRDHVVAAAWIRHTDWITDRGARPGSRTTPLDKARLHDWVVAGYEGRWDLLEVPTTAAPVLLPGRFRNLALAERVGLPVGHPWAEQLPDW